MKQYILLCGTGLILFFETTRYGISKPLEASKPAPLLACPDCYSVAKARVKIIFGSSVVLMYESFIVAKKNEKNVPASKQEKAGDGQFNKLKMIASFGYVYGVISAFAYAIGYVVRKEGLEEMPNPYVGTTIGALVGILEIKEDYSNVN
ncbi:hypothetical protein [Fictibacillus terranigra]|uniref:Uncharacterized protein n=1 Tax=Fictibacillus terranigra TaxID=3058424 RepID=A0ABT8EBX9_9BACL|nr:hypothetical protein [Fictibacillus sp. CENA-BCM004]MDN4075435.1 hypothetical protein [Fictibacillus sp. CENA-BCM004]